MTPDCNEIGAQTLIFGVANFVHEQYRYDKSYVMLVHIELSPHPPNTWSSLTSSSTVSLIHAHNVVNDNNIFETLLSC